MESPEDTVPLPSYRWFSALDLYISLSVEQAKLGGMPKTGQKEILRTQSSMHQAEFCFTVENCNHFSCIHFLRIHCIPLFLLFCSCLSVWLYGEFLPNSCAKDNCSQLIQCRPADSIETFHYNCAINRNFLFTMSSSNYFPFRKLLHY